MLRREFPYSSAQITLEIHPNPGDSLEKNKQKKQLSWSFSASCKGLGECGLQAAFLLSATPTKGLSGAQGAPSPNKP